MTDFSKLQKVTEEKATLEKEMKELREQIVDDIVKLLISLKGFSYSDKMLFYGDEWDVGCFIGAVREALEELNK